MSASHLADNRGCFVGDTYTDLTLGHRNHRREKETLVAGPVSSSRTEKKLKMVSGKNYFLTEIQAESVPESDEVGIGILEVVDLARQINLEENSEDVQELLDFYN
ncbi:hypothetical protein TNCV_4473321 [Trichonephila clavipes]|uniref:Uncharacterized protein n=1 Tax=Trichonephila clavipes TaxID=2585209 RepID=A0A8X6VL37_TRICX|nr:hypothetical protein TNCV_4473321 [Trichonephila clavipes]